MMQERVGKKEAGLVSASPSVRGHDLPNGLVIGSRHDCISIGADGNAPDIARMPIKRVLLHARLQIPHPIQ